AALGKSVQKTLVIPAGTYIVSAPLVPSSDTVVVVSSGAVIQAKAGTMWKATGIFDVNGVSNVSIIGPGTLDGNKQGNPAGRMFGVQVRGGSSNIWISSL